MYRPLISLALILLPVALILAQQGPLVGRWRSSEVSPTGVSSIFEFRGDNQLESYSAVVSEGKYRLIGTDTILLQLDKSREEKQELEWDNNRAVPDTDAARAHFRQAHERATREAHARVSGLRPEPTLSYEQLVSLVQQKIKYVFVLYQENRSFDSYFGTFPGANGLYSQTASSTPGFVQSIVNTDGTTGTVSPFRIGPTQYAADTDDVDHSHGLTTAKMDIQNGAALMDKFAATEELKYSPTGNPSLQAKQMGELTMAYEDCDTIPLIWAYADRFVLFDNIFEAMTGPSTPGNLSIIGAQAGETQWALHPTNTTATVPLMVDDDPFWGSPSDKSASPLPVNPGDYPGYSVASNLTFATLPLSMLQSTAATVTATDPTASSDLVDVTDDVAFLSKLTQPAVTFGWYEEGFDKESTDTAGPVTANGSHASYITHHNDPSIFGYISNTPALRAQAPRFGRFLFGPAEQHPPHGRRRLLRERRLHQYHGHHARRSRWHRAEELPRR